MLRISFSLPSTLEKKGTQIGGWQGWVAGRYHLHPPRTLEFWNPRMAQTGQPITHLWPPLSQLPLFPGAALSLAALRPHQKGKEKREYVRGGPILGGLCPVARGGQWGLRQGVPVGETPGTCHWGSSLGAASAPQCWAESCTGPP